MELLNMKSKAAGSVSQRAARDRVGFCREIKSMLPIKTKLRAVKE